MWKHDIEQRYRKIRAETDRLQREFGIKPRTLEERYQDYQIRLHEEQRAREQLQLLEELRAQQPKPLRKTPL